MNKIHLIWTSLAIMGSVSILLCIIIPYILRRKAFKEVPMDSHFTDFQFQQSLLPGEQWKDVSWDEQGKYGFMWNDKKGVFFYERRDNQFIMDDIIMVSPRLSSVIFTKNKWKDSNQAVFIMKDTFQIWHQDDHKWKRIHSLACGEKFEHIFHHENHCYIQFEHTLFKRDLDNPLSSLSIASKGERMEHISEKVKSHMKGQVKSIGENRMFILKDSKVEIHVKY